MSHRHSSSIIVAGFIGAGLVLIASQGAHAQTAVTPPGAGTEADPYRISELGHLVWMGDSVTGSADQYYAMVADIDASATAGWNDANTGTDIVEGFRPIGAYSSTDTTSFRGGFEAGGHTIAGLVINRPNTDYVGLFGYIGRGGTVRNLGLIGGKATGSNKTGGLVGYNLGTVWKCYATSVVGGNNSVGGLAGDNDGILSSCHATGVVTGNNSVGGLSGSSNSAVLNCYATGAVTGAGSSVGGLVGSAGNYATVSNSSSTGAVMGSYEVGGLVGYSASTVTNCYATGAAMAGGYVGGLVGFNSLGAVSYCYATGTVPAVGEFVGGLVGRSDSVSVLSSYWDVQTSGRNTSAGGTGKTTEQMKQLATYVGWNFNTLWDIGMQTYPYFPNLVSPSPTGDFDYDADVDLEDFGHLQACLTGPLIPQADLGCQDARLAGHSYVDETDVAIFLQCLTGPGAPVDPSCAN